MTTELRILILEDISQDAELMERALRNLSMPFQSMRVESKEAFLHSLSVFNPDLVLADYSLPQFDAIAALALIRELDPDLPVIIVTGSINEETAVACMKAGAADYVLK